jgi:hypothetical protein
MYQVLISMPDGKLLVGEGDSDDPVMPHRDGWHLNVRFDGRMGKLVVQDSKANLVLDDLTIFDVHNVTGGLRRIVDGVDIGRHEYVYRATVDGSPITIGIALGTSVKDTSWLNHGVVVTP